MNKTLFYIGVAVALVVGLVGGHYLFPSAGGLGAASITPYNCLNNQILCNELSAIASPLTAIQQSTTITTTTAQLSANGTSTAIKFATFTATSSVGDVVLLGVGTPTANILYSAQITAANTVQVAFTNTSSSAITPATTTFNITILPAASFIAPVGL